MSGNGRKKKISTKKVCEAILEELAGGADMPFVGLAEALTYEGEFEDIHVRRALKTLMDSEPPQVTYSDGYNSMSKNSVVRLTDNEEKAQYMEKRANLLRIKDQFGDVTEGIDVVPTNDGIEVSACVILDSIEDAKRVVVGWSSFMK